MIFLTDGRNWMGPYHPDEVQARVNGNRELREVQGAGQVWSITADTLDEAKAKFSAEVKRFDKGRA